MIYPVVGGEATLTDLVNEYRATGTEYQRQKRKVFKASYTNHYRRGLIRLLGVLEFRSNNTAHQPVIDALAADRPLRPRTAARTTRSASTSSWTAPSTPTGPSC